MIPCTYDSGSLKEALRRIREAEPTEVLELDLSGLVDRLSRKLASLTFLQSLNLSWCKQLSDLSPLATLTSLQALNGIRYDGSRDVESMITALTAVKR